MKPVTTILDWFLPPLCPATGQNVDVHGTVAPDYWGSLRFIRPPCCPRCAMPFPYDMGTGPELICASCLENPPIFRAGRAALVYDEASRKIILRFKHGDQLQALRTLVPWLVEAGGDVAALADVIIPVPLHRWRFLKRRYNQSALLAQGVGRALGKLVLVDGLQRVRATPPQAKKKRDERLKNVTGAFSVRNAASIKDKNVLLIDDVFTTGATLNACAETLLDAGAAGVDILCIARVVKD